MTEFSTFFTGKIPRALGCACCSGSGFVPVNWALPRCGFPCSSGSFKAVSLVWLWKWRRKIRVRGAISKHQSLISSCSGETGSDSDASEAKSLESPRNSAAEFAGKYRPGSIAVSSRLLIRKTRISKLIASPGILMGPHIGLP